MKRLLYPCLVLLLGGCAADPTPAYYALTLASDPAPAKPVSQGPVLVVERISLPDYLNDLGIAYQQDDVQIVQANQARWAEALDRQLGRAVQEQLSRQLERVQVVPGPASPPDAWHLWLEVEGFQGRYDGRALVAGRWRLQQGERIYSQAFAEAVPLDEDGYPALVRALRKGWQEQVAQMAEQLRPLLLPPK